MPEKAQRSTDLVQRTDAFRQGVALRVVPEERVEHLFHAAQIVHRLAHEGGHREAFLGGLAEAAQPVGHLRVSGSVALDRGQQPLGHCLAMAIVIRARARAMLQRLLGEEDRRGDLEREGVAQRGRHRVQLAARLSERPSQRSQTLGGQLLRRVAERVDRLGEAREFAGTATAHLVEGNARPRQAIARRAQHTFVEAPVAWFVEVARNRILQRKRFLHRLRHRRRIGQRGQREQHVLDQALGDRSTVLNRLAQLQIEAREQSLDLDVDRDASRGQRLEVRLRHPPERAVGAREPGAAHQVDRLAHPPGAAGGAGLAHQVQQAALETRTCLPQRLRVDFGVVRVRLGKTNREVGEKEVRRMDPLRPPGLEQRAIVRIQVKRLGRRVAKQFLAVLDHRVERALKT